MASIEKRFGGCRMNYRDPLGRQKSKSFVTKDDARRFSREIEVDKTRGAWLDPTGADIQLAEWAETFLGLCRCLSPRTHAETSPHTSSPASVPTG